MTHEEKILNKWRKQYKNHFVTHPKYLTDTKADDIISTMEVPLLKLIKLSQAEQREKDAKLIIEMSGGNMDADHRGMLMAEAIRNQKD